MVVAAIGNRIKKKFHIFAVITNENGWIIYIKLLRLVSLSNIFSLVLCTNCRIFDDMCGEFERSSVFDRG